MYSSVQRMRQPSFSSHFAAGIRHPLMRCKHNQASSVVERNCEPKRHAQDCRVQGRLEHSCAGAGQSNRKLTSANDQSNPRSRFASNSKVVFAPPDGHAVLVRFES